MRGLPVRSGDDPVADREVRRQTAQQGGRGRVADFRAMAAATRTGVKIECIEFDPPVSWFQSSSGRASAKVICTWSTRQVHLFGDGHGHGGGDPLADLGPGQGERGPPVGVDDDRDEVRGHHGRIGQQVTQVVVLGRLRPDGMTAPAGLPERLHEERGGGRQRRSRDR